MGKPKKRKVAGFMRIVLAANVRAFMDHQFQSDGNRPKALAEKAGLSFSTIQRILAAETGASLDNIEALAAVFDLSVYQLLVPSLSLENPQIIKGATKEEERMYRNWRRDDLIKEGEEQREPAPAKAPAG